MKSNNKPAFSALLDNAEEQGIERLVSWFFFITLHFFPGIYVRKFTPKNSRNICIEGFVVLKCALAITVFLMGWYTSNTWMGVLVWLGIETVLYSLFFIICNNLYPRPASYKRVLILGVINYFEIVFVFAAVYVHFTLVAKTGGASASPMASIDYLYFSVATGGVLGFGDYTITSATGKGVAMLQCIVFMMYFILFITFNMSMFMEGKPRAVAAPGPTLPAPATVAVPVGVATPAAQVPVPVPAPDELTKQ